MKLIITNFPENDKLISDIPMNHLVHSNVAMYTTEYAGLIFMVSIVVS